MYIYIYIYLHLSLSLSLYIYIYIYILYAPGGARLDALAQGRVPVIILPVLFLVYTIQYHVQVVVAGVVVTKALFGIDIVTVFGLLVTDFGPGCYDHLNYNHLSAVLNHSSASPHFPQDIKSAEWQRVCGKSKGLLKLSFQAAAAENREEVTRYFLYFLGIRYFLFGTS